MNWELIVAAVTTIDCQDFCWFWSDEYTIDMPPIVMDDELVKAMFVNEWSENWPRS